MALRKRKHRQFFRILIIPDDRDEPSAFNLSVRMLHFLKIAAVVLMLHFIFGIVFYVRYLDVRDKNEKLVSVNRQLEENMTKINTLLAEFEVLENDQDKLRHVLGLGSLNGIRTSTKLLIPEENRTVNYLPNYRRGTQKDQKKVSNLDRYNFLLKASKSPVHSYVKSIPTMLPVDGILSADYENDSKNGSSQHRGIDIAGNMGDLVKASADGVIIFSDWTFDLGNLVIVYHGNGFYTYYGHNQRCLLPRGSFIKKGESIATLGNTGISSAPHLHFEIWKDGISYDPKDFILAFSDI